MPATDPDRFDLVRFVRAQEDNYGRALAELRAGRKETHWMWYVFPQLRGLGHSPNAHAYGIGSVEEAVAYVAHPLLGARLRECVAVQLALPDSDPARIFGGVDAMKLRSSLTLFRAVGGDALFTKALAKFYAGDPDARTLTLLAGMGRTGHD
jgi:uncharacterized protein (DUF1810 family)